MIDMFELIRQGVKLRKAEDRKMPEATRQEDLDNNELLKQAFKRIHRRCESSEDDEVSDEEFD